MTAQLFLKIRQNDKTRVSRINDDIKKRKTRRKTHKNHEYANNARETKCEIVYPFQNWYRQCSTAFASRHVFHDDGLLWRFFIANQALFSTFSRVGDNFYPFVPRVAPIRNESTLYYSSFSLSSLYVTIVTATGLSVASVLCANRSMLFFDMCNIPCVNETY